MACRLRITCWLGALGPAYGWWNGRTRSLPPGGAGGTAFQFRHPPIAVVWARRAGTHARLNSRASMTPLFFLTLLGALSARGNDFPGYLDEVPSDLSALSQ